MIFYYKDYPIRVRQVDPSWIREVLNTAGYDIRNESYLCGYVGLFRDNLFFGTIPDGLQTLAHKGITYSKLEGTVWWLGFDLGHADDQPGSVEYVVQKCRDMIDWLCEAEAL